MFSITAKSGSGTPIATTSNSFSFTVDFSGKSSLETKSALSDSTKSLSKPATSKSTLEKISLRSGGSLVYCEKPMPDCTDSDWTAVQCSSGCSVSGTTVTYSTTKFGTYGLSGSVVTGSANTPPPQSSANAASVLFASVAALLYCICV